MITERTFSFYLSFNNNTNSKGHENSFSELIIGGYDPKYMVENFTYAKVVDDFYWGVKVDAITMGNTSLDIYAGNTMDLVGIIDSGTSLIYLDLGTY